mgnify:CR=1 FL=1
MFVLKVPGVFSNSTDILSISQLVHREDIAIPPSKEDSTQLFHWDALSELELEFVWNLNLICPAIKPLDAAVIFISYLFNPKIDPQSNILALHVCWNLNKYFRE